MRTLYLNIISLVILLCMSLVSGTAPNQQCIWQDKKGNQYDLNPLTKRPYWEVSDDLTGMGMFNMIYIFNFCSYQGIQCGQEQATSYEALQVLGEITDNCDILSRSTVMDVERISPSQDLGLKIVMSGGDECVRERMMGGDIDSTIIRSKRQSTFMIQCEDGQEDSTFTVDNSDSCNTIFKIRHPAGCMERGSFLGFFGASYFRVNLCLFVVFGAYFAIGYLYNSKTQGKQGFEALPHSTFWIDFPSFVIEGLKYSLKQCKATFGQIKPQGIASQQGQYSTV